MNKILKITLATTMAFSLSGFLQASEVGKLDVKTMCDVEKNGIQNVLSTATKYNTMAKKEGLEFMRLGMKTSQYIAALNTSVEYKVKSGDTLSKISKHFYGKGNLYTKILEENSDINSNGLIFPGQKIKIVQNELKTIDILDKKKKKTGTVTAEYAAWRACSFAISALTQAQESKTTWMMAVPGDGYKY